MRMLLPRTFQPSFPILTLIFAIILLVQFEPCSSTDTRIYSLKLRTSPLSRDVTVSSVRKRRSVDPQDGKRWRFAKHNLRGQADQGYYIEMAIGTPKQYLNVLVDTGSANFAVAAAPHKFINKYYHTNRSSTYKDLKRKVKVPYTQGEWDGKLCQDVSSIVTGPNVGVSANIAAITHSEQFFINGSNWQGILGLGYPDIARPDSTVEPFFHTLVREGHVEDVFAMQLCGPNQTQTSDAEVAGTMTVGGIDGTLYNSTMWRSPLIRERFYEIVIVDMEVNNRSLGMDCKEYNFNKVIVDTGTTNLRLPEEVFARLNSEIARTAAASAVLGNQTIPPEFWTGDQLICKDDGPIEPYDWWPSISIALQGMNPGEAYKLVISPKQYLRKVEPESEGVYPSHDCYKYGISSSDTGTVIGAVAMEGFYVVFDRANKSVGFAVSTCAGNTDSLLAPRIIGPLRISSIDCAYDVPVTNNTTLLIVAYIMAALCVICLVVPMVFLYVHWQMEKCRDKQDDVPEPDENGLLSRNDSDS